MKKKTNKLLTLMVCAGLCFSAGVFTACKSETPTVYQGVDLLEEELSLELHGEYTLNVTVVGEGTPVWSSSDPSIVSVENGKITAHALGEATITVKFGEETESCIVTVYDAGYAASLTFNSQTVLVDVGETFMLRPIAKWKGETINDNVSYNVSLKEGNGVAQVTPNGDGTFTVKGLTYGASVWYVNGVVRGVELTETVQINVVDSGVTVVLNDKYQPVVGGHETQMTLSLTDDYTSQAFEPKLYKNNALISDAALTWESENENIAKYEDGKLLAIGAGVTRVSATYNGMPIYVDVNVIKPILQQTETFAIERLDGTGTQTIALMESLAGTPSAAYFADGTNVLQSGASDEVVLNQANMPKMPSQMGENIAFSIETERAIYEYSVDLYTQIINDATEFANYYTVGQSVYPDDALQSGGYFVLGENVDYGGATFALPAENAGFTGIFDGKGYAIENITVSWTGLFGTAGDGTVIKNLAMTNVVNNYDWVSAVLVRTYATAMDKVHFENIYMHFSEMKGCFRGNSYNGILFSGAGWSAEAKNYTFENVVIAVDNYTENVSPTYVLGKVSKNAGNIKNVYVYGTKNAYVNYSEGTTQERNRNNGDSDTFAVYETRADMVAANNNYKEFTANDFWKLAGGVPYPTKLEYTEKYTVQFIDGTTTLKQDVYSENETLTVAPSPSKEGTAFVGWKLANSDSLYDFTAAGATVVTSDMKFYAVWAETKESAKISEVEVVTGISGSGVSATVASTNSAYTIDVSDIKDEISGTIRSITIAGVEYTNVSYSDGTISVNEAIDKHTYGKTRYSALFDDNGVTTAVAGNALFITLKISNQEELAAYSSIGHDVAPTHTCANVSDPVYGYFTMDADITCTDYMTLGCVNWLGTTFYGTFDGCGHVIDNYRNSATWWAFTYRLGKDSVIRNVTFINLDNSESKTQGSLLACESWNGSGNVIENIYLHYSNYVNVGASLLVGAGGNGNNVSYKNIIVTADKVSGTTANQVIGAQQGNDGATEIQHVYAYGLGNSVLTNETNAIGSYAIYADLAEMIETGAYTAITSNGFWSIDNDGIPYPTRLADNYSFVKFVVDGATVSKKWFMNEVEFTVPDSPEKSGYAFKGWALNGANTAYDFTATDAKVVSSDMTFTALWLASAESATLSQVEVVTSINGSGATATIATQAENITLNVSDLKDQIVGTLQSVVIGNTTYTEDISYANGVITIGVAPTLTTYGEFAYSAFFTGDTEFVVTGKVLFITMAISNYDELKSFEAIGKLAYDSDDTTTNYVGYYILDANVDCTVDGAVSTYNATGKFQGTFDGCGYKISNLEMGGNGLFGEVLDGTVIKNFALTNTKNTSGDWGTGLLANNRDNGDAVNVSFENIYIHMSYVIECWKGDNTWNTLIMSKYSWNTGSANVTYTNIVVVADNYSNQTGVTSVVNAPANSGNIQNVYVCGYTAGAVNQKESGETSRGLDGDSADKDKYGEYDAISGLNADIAAGKIAATDFTDTGYWTYDATNGLAFVVKP